MKGMYSGQSQALSTPQESRLRREMEKNEGNLEKSDDTPGLDIRVLFLFPYTNKTRRRVDIDC
jgi:hypothetical protein